MQIDSLKVFCDLVETKSFTKAAQINEVTQSAVSQTITALEGRFKSLLIERSKKNFRLADFIPAMRNPSDTDLSAGVGRVARYRFGVV